MKKLILSLLALALTFPAAAVNPSLQEVQNLIKGGTPFRVISLRPPSNNDTNWYGPWTPGTTTAGIQEAINSLPRAASPTDTSKPGGGAIVFTPCAPEAYWIKDTITTPLVTNAFSLVFIGPGMTAGGITMTNTTSRSVMIVGHPNAGTLCNFEMRNMWMMTTNNTCTNILWLRGWNTVGGAVGGIGRATIEYNYIGDWMRATNQGCIGFTPSTCPVVSGPNNLVGIDVDCNFDDVITIRGNSINYCGTALSLAADHLVVHDNMFEHNGVMQGSTANDWPNTSIYKTGATIIFTEPTPNKNGGYAGGAFNGNKAWDVRNSYFVNCGVPYFINDGFGFRYDHCSYNDDLENCGVTTQVGTTGTRWTFVNWKSCQATREQYLFAAALSGGADYSTWKNVTTKTNLLDFDFLRGRVLDNFGMIAPGYAMPSNSVANWPTVPFYPGESREVMSNCFVYRLFSTNGQGGASATWTKTNYVGP